MATFNVLDGRGGGLELSAQALNLAEVNIAVVQETKFINPQYATKGAAGYKIRTAAAASVACGGLSLLWKDGEKDLFFGGKRQGMRTQRHHIRVSGGGGDRRIGEGGTILHLWMLHPAIGHGWDNAAAY